MAIGLFGGTFDPIHVGHLRVAQEVCEHFSLERVYFVPAWTQPLKTGLKAAEADDRLQMIKRAIRDNAFFRCSAAEIDRGGISYSIETLKAFGRRFSEIYFLIGLDAFADIGLWKSFGDLFTYAHFVVMVRPGRKADGLPAALKGKVRKIDDTTWEHASGKRIYFQHITQLDISSTMIRALSREGKSIKYLVPRSVEQYIAQRGLYTN
jgi:nicotinate-nucleotide adenylyltransferase